MIFSSEPNLPSPAAVIAYDIRFRNLSSSIKFLFNEKAI